MVMHCCRDAQGQWGPIVLGNTLMDGLPIQTLVDLSSPGNVLYATFTAFTPGTTVPDDALLEASCRVRNNSRKTAALER